MMALISNWDLKTENNSMYAQEDDSRPILYEVSDLGTSFGRTGESYRSSTSKANLKAYQRSKFLTKVTKDRVSFNFPTHLPYLYIFNLPLFISESRAQWIGHVWRADQRGLSGFRRQPDASHLVSPHLPRFRLAAARHGRRCRYPADQDRHFVMVCAECCMPLTITDSVNSSCRRSGRSLVISRT